MNTRTVNRCGECEYLEIPPDTPPCSECYCCKPSNFSEQKPKLPDGAIFAKDLEHGDLFVTSLATIDPWQVFKHIDSKNFYMMSNITMTVDDDKIVYPVTANFELRTSVEVDRETRHGG